jgi:two-component system chemotaxis response regulator CheY
MSGGSDDMMKLPAVLDLAASEDFLGAVHQQLQANPALCLDASSVETLTLPCVQIILAGVASGRVSVVNPSDAFVSAFRDMAVDWRSADEVAAASTPSASAAPPPVEALPIELPIAAAPELMAGEAMAMEAEPIASEPMAMDADPMASSEPMASEPMAMVPDAPLMASELAAMLDAMPEAAAMPAAAPDRLMAEPETVLPSHAAAAAAGASQPFEEQVTQPDPTDGASMAKRILTIDDSKTMRDMLMLTLAEAGFEVLQGVDGQHGLDVLGDQRVDVIITDINMPVMDGYGVIRNLRANPKHKTTPILVLTTESDAAKRVIAREAGATGWMVKPFDPDRLIATIHKVAP